MNHLEERFSSKTPKRILALDGGGIRGLLTLGFLEKVEQILRDRHNNQNLLLCEYFDLIGGTSTGAIIAAALAKGMTVGEIKEKYLGLGNDIFRDKRMFLKTILGPKFQKDKIEKYLHEVFEDYTLGDSRLKTGLAIVAKRADTGSNWLLNNNPKDKYYEDNKDILLKNVIRASSAAPTYFEPESFEVKKGQIGVFIDGGVGMFNNPALQLFFMSVVKGYNLNWGIGEDRLMILSLGTGGEKTKPSKPEDFNNLDFAKTIPEWLMYDAGRLGQKVMQMFSNSPTPQYFDRVEGNFETPDNIVPLMHYLRYDAPLNAETLTNVGKAHLIPNLEDIKDMASPKHCQDLFDIGSEAAKIQINTNHFPTAFDIGQPTI